MTRMLIAALLTSAACPMALAATFEPDSKIDAVTVYPSGAQVTRISTLDLSAGDHTIIIDDLPASIDPASVRVSGVAGAELAIGGVDVRSQILESGGTDAERQRLEERLEELDDLTNTLRQEKADIDLRRNLMQTLVSRSGMKGTEPSDISGDTLSQTLSVVAEELSDLNKLSTETRAMQRRTQKEIDRVRAELSLLAPKREQRTIVEIAVSVGAQTAAGFDIKYNVREAGWRAIYDANLSLEDGVKDIDIGIKRRALIEQSTQESWKDVELVLSTARPTSATKAPNLQANALNLTEPPTAKSTDFSSQRIGTGLRLGAGNSDAAVVMERAAAPAPVEQLEVAVERVAAMNTGGFNASFKIADRVTVANTNEAKSVLLGVDSWSVDVSALSVPRLDPTAYLMAEFELGGELTYLPGAVLLNRDGTYIGRGQMPLLAPGKTHQLGFGNDDYVTVERIERDRKSGDSGVFYSSKVETRDADIVVVNNHDFEMPVRIIDSMPVSDHEDIQIEGLRNNTPPSQKDVDGKRGVMAFDYDLQAGEEKRIRIGYKVTWPSDMKMTRLP